MVLGGGPLHLRKSLASLIVRFIKDHDDSDMVHTNWEDGLYQQILRLLSVGQVLAYIREGRMTGVFGWAFLDGITGVNKIRWTLPDNITGGHILYVSFGVIENNERVGYIRKYLYEPEFKWTECVWRYKNRLFKTKRSLKWL